MSKTPATPGRHFIFALFIIVAIVFADQYSKWLVMETMLRVTETIPDFTDWFFARQPLEYFIMERETFRTIAITPYLNFVMVWNQGISFGMLDTNNAHMPMVLMAISLVISLCLMVWLVVSHHWFISVALSFIIGGALGNVLDRIRFRAVADFIDLHLEGQHWPAFNIADSFVVVGAILLMLHTVFSKNNDRHETGA